MESMMQSIQTQLYMDLSRKKDDIILKSITDKGLDLAECLLSPQYFKRFLIEDWELYYYDETFIIAFKNPELKFNFSDDFHRNSHSINATIQYQTTLPIIDKK